MTMHMYNDMNDIAGNVAAVPEALSLVDLDDFFLALRSQVINSVAFSAC